VRFSGHIILNQIANSFIIYDVIFFCVIKLRVVLDKVPNKVAILCARIRIVKSKCELLVFWLFGFSSRIFELKSR
jgi:hypothetical protein